MARTLSTAQKKAIALELHNSSDTQKAIGDRYDVHVSTVRRITDQFKVKRPKARRRKD